MTDLFDRYQREVLPTLAPRTQKDYAKHIKTLRGIFGAMRPNDVKPKDVGALIIFGHGQAQSVKLVAVLSAVFSKGVGRWYICDRNPCHDVERPKAGKRDRYVSDAEYQALYSIMPVRMQIAMDLALLTGQRQGDLLKLTWEQVDTVGKDRADWSVRFRQGKTGKRIRIEIDEALEAVFARARKLVPQFPRKYVIRTGPRSWVSDPGGKAYTSDGFRACWQRHMRRAMKLGLLKERFTFHDLRAKNISDTENLEDAMKRAGHMSMSMTRGVYDRGERLVKPLARKKQAT
jgi:integrase